MCGGCIFISHSILFFFHSFFFFFFYFFFNLFQTGAKLEIPRNPIPGDAGRDITIRGAPEEVEYCRVRIEELLQSVEQPETPR